MIEFLRWLALPFDDKWIDADQIDDWCVTRFERRFHDRFFRPVALWLVRLFEEGGQL